MQLSPSKRDPLDTTPERSPSRALPWRGIILPPLLPLGLVAFAALTERLGVVWSIHGWGGLLLMAIVVSGLVVAILEMIQLAQRLRILAREVESRTLRNAAPMLWGGGFLVLIWIVVLRQWTW